MTQQTYLPIVILADNKQEKQRGFVQATKINTIAASRYFERLPDGQGTEQEVTELTLDNGKTLLVEGVMSEFVKKMQDQGHRFLK